ncbi:MAG: UDP-N-acetylmuramoyl-L-alanine--D-glutamate ligase [Candidatus Eisenbacteria bacterium]
MITGWADDRKKTRRRNGAGNGIGTDLNGRRVVVVGLARSGKAAVELLLSRGARVTATDVRPESELALGPDPWKGRNVRLELGEHPAGVLHGADLVVVSPGVPSDSPVVDDAAERGIPVIGELELAFRLSRGTWLAVTGTNGKTTTTALLGALVARAGHPTVVAGNIGVALSSEVARIPDDGYVVAEVSSFQLDTVVSFRPRVGVLLNITEDHLDRYESFEAYAASKRRIFENQVSTDFAVLNVDDRLVGEIAGTLASTVIPVSTEREVAGGVFVRDGAIVSQFGGRESEVIRVDELGLPGPHNLANSAAATAAALAIGVDVGAVAEELRAFRPLPHRMEDVCEVDGVRFVNDSKATNVESVACALGSYRSPIVLIAGGKDKGTDFGRLRELVERNVRALVLIGETAGKLESALSGAAPIERAASLEEAVRMARQWADPGDVVLLSPACASFDMFRDYEDRGDAFREAVRALSTESGRACEREAK